MLYDDVTNGGVICGWKVSTDGQLTGAEAEEILEAVDAANEKHGTQVRMIVPGDSATDHSMDPEMELYAYELVFGVPVVIAESWDCPAEVTREALERARANAAEVEAGFWADVAGSSSIFDGFAAGEPGTYLTCWGPLPAVALVAGAVHPTKKRDDTVYKFHSVVDMDQMPVDNGVDGVGIAYGDFTSVVQVDLSDEAIEGWLEKASKLDDPKIYLTVRYD